MPLPIGLDRSGKNYCYFSAAIQTIVEVPGVQEKLAELLKQQPELHQHISGELAQLYKKYPHSKFVKNYQQYFPFSSPEIFEKKENSNQHMKEQDQDKSNKSDLNHQNKKEGYFSFFVTKISTFLVNIFNAIKLFLYNNIIKPIKDISAELFNNEEQVILEQASPEENRETKVLIEKMKKYYLIELLPKLHGANNSNKFNREELFSKEWDILKDLVLKENYCNGESTVAMAVIKIQDFIEIGLRDVFNIESNMTSRTTGEVHITIDDAIQVDTEYDQETCVFPNNCFEPTADPTPVIDNGKEYYTAIYKYSPIESTKAILLKTDRLCTAKKSYDIQPPTILYANSSKFYLHSISMYSGAHYTVCRAYFNNEKISWLELNDTSVKEMTSLLGISKKPYDLIYVHEASLSEQQKAAYAIFDQNNFLQFTYNFKSAERRKNPVLNPK